MLDGRGILMEVKFVAVDSLGTRQLAGRTRSNLCVPVRFSNWPSRACRSVAGELAVVAVPEDCLPEPDRQTVIDDGVSKRLTLKKGANVIRAAVVNGGGATDFCARNLDGSDKPLTDLVVYLRP